MAEEIPTDFFDAGAGAATSPQQPPDTAFSILLSPFRTLNFQF
jgi:hypothetical protein